jgi:hypothetical protein
MTSPFSTFQEFSEAKGPIYTFANNPTMIGILLLICLGITIYFFYASFQIDRDHRLSPGALGMLLLASGVSLVTALLPLQSPKQPVEAARTEYRAEKRQPSPLALGMTLTGSVLSAAVKPFLKRRSSRSRRR